MTMFIHSVFRHVVIKAKRIYMIRFGHQVYVHAYQLDSQQIYLETRLGYSLVRSDGRRRIGPWE